jgi:hypothetical protein
MYRREPSAHAEPDERRVTDDEDDTLRTDPGEWLENQIPERGRPAQVEGRLDGSSGPSSQA